MCLTCIFKIGFIFVGFLNNVFGPLVRKKKKPLLLLLLLFTVRIVVDYIAIIFKQTKKIRAILDLRIN